MNNIKMNYLTIEEANLILESFKGKVLPTENRVLIVSPTGDTKVGDIIIPGTTKEGKPRKGVVIMPGIITEEYESYKNITTGSIVTYGLYAGKEVEFDDELIPGDLYLKMKEQNFSVLSLNEIILIETNK